MVPDTCVMYDDHLQRVLALALANRRPVFVPGVIAKHAGHGLVQRFPRSPICTSVLN